MFSFNECGRGGVGSFGLCAVCLEVPVGNVGGDGGRVSTSQE